MINTFRTTFCEMELKLHNLIVLNWKKFTWNEFIHVRMGSLCGGGGWRFFFETAMYKSILAIFSLSLFSVRRRVYKTKRCCCSCCCCRCCVYVLLLLLLFILLMLTMMTQYTVVNIVTLAYFVYRLCVLVFIPHTRITIVHNNKNELYYVHRRIHTAVWMPMPTVYMGFTFYIYTYNSTHIHSRSARWFSILCVVLHTTAQPSTAMCAYAWMYGIVSILLLQRKNNSNNNDWVL